MKAGERYEMENMENEQKREIKLISWAGEVTSKKWGDSYNVQNLDKKQTSWVNMRVYRNF